MLWRKCCDGKHFPNYADMFATILFEFVISIVCDNILLLFIEVTRDCMMFILITTVCTVHVRLPYILRPICEIAQFMNWAPLMPSSWTGQ